MGFGTVQGGPWRKWNKEWGGVGLKGGVCESGVLGWFLSFSVGRGVFSCVCFSLPDKKLYLCKVFCGMPSAACPILFVMKNYITTFII